MGFVAIVAVSLAAIRFATDEIASAVLWFVYATLVATTLVGVVRGRRAEGCWGFAVAGWAYFSPVFAFASASVIDGLPTSRLPAAYIQRATPGPRPSPGVEFVTEGPNHPAVRTVEQTDSYVPGSVDLERLFSAIEVFNASVEAAVKTGHLFATLPMGWIGSGLALWLGRPRRRAASRPGVRRTGGR